MTDLCKQQVLPRTLFHLVYFVVVFRGLSSRIHHLHHRHESQKSSGLIDGAKNDGQKWIIVADQI
jgi:hypothetical protein